MNTKKIIVGLVAVLTFYTATAAQAFPFFGNSGYGNGYYGNRYGGYHRHCHRHRHHHRGW